LLTLKLSHIYMYN